jgi:DNA polymerase III alpha subunit
MILHFHSYFSLRYGLMSPEEIVQRCEAECMSMKIKIPILLADINTVTGIPNFLRLAKNTKHIIPLVGVEIRNGDELLYTLISRSQSGYAAINRFLSIHLTTKSNFPAEPPRLEDVYVVGQYQPKSHSSIQHYPSGT